VKLGARCLDCTKKTLSACSTERQGVLGRARGGKGEAGRIWMLREEKNERGRQKPKRNLVIGGRKGPGKEV
jgi:hypothetical protein